MHSIRVNCYWSCTARFLSLSDPSSTCILSSGVPRWLAVFYHPCHMILWRSRSGKWCVRFWGGSCVWPGSTPTAEYLQSLVEFGFHDALKIIESIGAAGDLENDGICWHHYSLWKFRCRGPPHAGKFPSFVEAASSRPMRIFFSRICQKSCTQFSTTSPPALMALSTMVAVGATLQARPEKFGRIQK